MDLEIDNQRFIVCGASSGFGKAVAKRIMEENGNVYGIARREKKLEELKQTFSENFEYLSGDLTQSDTLDRVEDYISGHRTEGVVINAGGPPPGSAMEFSMEKWDEAYTSVMRWKIALIQRVIPLMKKQEYGRILLIESQSIKQPIPDLALSNTFRAGIAGFAKTLSREVSSHGITINILAPGAHNTPAIERVVKRKAKKNNIKTEEARQLLKDSIPVGRMGRPEEFSSLAAWLLSPLSSYVTGQVLSHEGGNIEGLFG